MEWYLEERSNHVNYSWKRSAHQIPIGYDEVKVKSFLRYLRSQYPASEFRVLKVLNW